MCTASTRCSTARRASGPLRRGRGPSRGCPRSRSPTTATCSAPTTSGRRRRPRASSRSSAPRRTSRRAPHAATRPGCAGAAARQSQDDVGGSGAYTHMTLLSENNEGMHNLFKLSSLASIEGFYFKPRMDRELLSRYSKGVIATTGCVGGEVQTRLRLGQYDEARKAAAEFQDIFGKGNFFAEIMDHGIDIERRTMQDLLRLAKELGLPLVATNDLHYTHAHDATAHAALLCVQSASTLDDPNRFKFDSDEFYLKSAAQMRAALPRPPRGLRQHPAHRRALRGQLRAPRPHAAVPGARGRDRGELVREGGRRGHAAALQQRAVGGAPRAGEVRGRRHQADGLPRLLPRGRRLHRVGEERRASGSVRVAVRRPGRWPRTRWASPSSTRSPTV